MTPEPNHGNRRQFWRRLLLALGVQVFGLICIGAAIELRRATQSEVNSGSRVNAYVAPYELSQWTGAGGGPTNGQTAAQVGALIKKTNDAFAGVFGTNGTSGTFQFSTTGTNAILAVATNAPGFGGGGSVPSGLVTNSAPADIVITNAGVSTRITSNSVSTATATITTVNATTMTGNASGLTNMPFYSLTFNTNLGINTNWCVGWINFTNGGRWLTIPIFTNQ